MSTFNTRCPNCKALNRVPISRVSEPATCGKCKTDLLDGAPVEATPANLAALLSGEQPVVVDFWAPWCNPCIGFAPVFEQVAREHKGAVRFVKLDTEANQALAAQYQIRSIPTIMVFKNGKRLDVVNGALPYSQFSAWLSAALAK